MNKIYYNKKYLIIAYVVAVINLSVWFFNFVDGGIDKRSHVIMALTGGALLLQCLIWSFSPLIEIGNGEIIIKKGLFKKKTYKVSEIRVKSFDKGLTFIGENGVGEDVWKMLFSKRDFEMIIKAVNERMV